MFMDTNNKILFFGDTHGGFDHCTEIVRQIKPQAIVFLGDIQTPYPFHEQLADIINLTEVWWIHGNHDTDTEQQYDNLFLSELKHRNLSGRVCEVAGVRIAGLGGVFRGKIWDPAKPGWNFYSPEAFIAGGGFRASWRNGVNLRHRSTIFPSEYEALLKEKADVLVTHEAPSCNRFGFQVLDELARHLGVHTHFHGHHHDNYDYSTHYARMGFRTFAVGYRGVTALDGRIIFPGEMDGQHENRVARILHGG